MIVGHDKHITDFKKLAGDKALSHGYIFFGEPHVGKFTFATALAHYLERGEFEVQDGGLQETLVVSPDESFKIGIDAVRDIRSFLWQKPLSGGYRITIIDDAQLLTPQAQNAILKIAEEPPEYALLILVLANPETLVSTLVSRFQKIYFSRLPDTEVQKFLIMRCGVSESQAVKLAKESLGRPGHAYHLFRDDDAQMLYKAAESIASGKNKDVPKIVFEDPQALDRFVEFLMIVLRRYRVERSDHLKELLYRLMMIRRYNTNKRLQLEAALWTISKN